MKLLSFITLNCYDFKVKEKCLTQLWTHKTEAESETETESPFLTLQIQIEIQMKRGHIKLRQTLYDPPNLSERF